MNDQNYMLNKPRRDLREPAFRRYEDYIARACEESFTVDISKLEVSAATFAARFRDAVLAFERFHYPSTKIRATVAELDNIHVRERLDGSVYVENPQADSRKLELARQFSLDDEASLLRLMKEVHDRKHPACARLPIKDAEVAKRAIAFVNERCSSDSLCYARIYEGDVVFMPMHSD